MPMRSRTETFLSRYSPDNRIDRVYSRNKNAQVKLKREIDRVDDHRAEYGALCESRPETLDRILSLPDRMKFFNPVLTKAFFYYIM